MLRSKKLEVRKKKTTNVETGFHRFGCVFIYDFSKGSKLIPKPECRDKIDSPP
jgi:hypothetical protein